MKKIIAVLLAVLFVCGALAACGGNSGNTDETKAADNGETQAAADADFKAGVVLDEKNTGFTVTAYFKDGHSEEVTGWTVDEPRTLEDAKVSVVTITYEKASTQCEVQCTTGLIQSITAEYDGDTSAGTQISDSNPGLHVYAIRDGVKSPLESGWRVSNPSVLEKEKITTVNIEYEEFSCSLSIQCTTREIMRLTAAYTGSHYEDSVCTLEVTCTTPTPEEYKAGCISASYSSLYRNPAKYTGINVVVEGTIIEIRPGEDGSTDVFIEMSGDFLGLTTGVLCATYTSTLHGQLPPEGVPVKIYGMYKEVSARMMDGSSMSMPVMNAEYVDRR